MSRKNWTDEKLFFRLVNNKSDKTYWDNIRELRSRANSNIFNACVKLIKSSRPKERIIGIDILAQLGLSPRPFFKESRKLFFDILKKEKDPKALFSLLYAIGHNNEKLNSDEMAILVSFKDNADKTVREGLVSALLSVDNKSAIDTLIHLTTDKVSHIRDWATFGIGTQIERNNEDIRNALWGRINDKHTGTKYEAIVGLANRLDIKIKGAIEIELKNPDFSALLFEAIATLKAIEYLPELKKILKASRGDETINKRWRKDLKDCISFLNKERQSESS